MHTQKERTASNLPLLGGLGRLRRLFRDRAPTKWGDLFLIHVGELVDSHRERDLAAFVFEVVLNDTGNLVAKRFEALDVLLLGVVALVGFLYVSSSVCLIRSGRKLAGSINYLKQRPQHLQVGVLVEVLCHRIICYIRNFLDVY